MSLPIIPENAPFTESQRLWLNGYLAGLFSSSVCSGVNGQASGPVLSGGQVPAPRPAPSRGPLLFLYGTQTGGAEILARKFARKAEKCGFTPSVHGMETFAEIDFSTARRLAVITSTYGDGEMPDNARDFWTFLNGGGTPPLGHLEYSVLALGDTNYPLFCEAGRKIDARLEHLGARRIHSRVDCDTDFEESASGWFQGLLDCLGANGVQTDSSALTSAAGPVPASPCPGGENPAYGRDRPFPARLKTNRNLNGAGSARETRHLELVLDGSGLEYEAGDALGVMPLNCPQFVREILETAGLEDTEEVSLAGGRVVPLGQALTENFELKPFLQAPPAAGTSAADLLAPLKKLQPRLYSIASSLKAHPGEVHLTVSAVRYELNGHARKGVCSTYLADHAERGDAAGLVPVFVHRSPHFRLPADRTRPVVMVGPGTGVAPFRGFLQERRATGARGKNWLFCGGQTRTADFLYGDELTAMRQDGLLARLDPAFSRDQPEKIYVQHRMLENAAELWAWLQDEGGYFYVCGDAAHMARDVDAALHRIAESTGGLEAEAAAAWVAALRREKRYLRDVY